MNWKRLPWSRGERAGLWYPSSRVQTRPKPSDFSGEKILSEPSFGGEIKPSVPCRKFTWRGSRHFRQNSRKFLAHSSIFRCWGSLASFQTLGTPCGESWNVLITGPPGWGLTCYWQRHSARTFLVDQAKTNKGCRADWRRRRRLINWKGCGSKHSGVP